MPKGMIQALLGTAPNSQEWALIDLSNCIFWNTEAADSIDELVRTLKSLGTAGGPTAQDPKQRTPEVGSDLIRIFPRMRSLHDTRRDWLSDEELCQWLGWNTKTMSHPCPKALLEANGRIFPSSEHEHRILDSESWKKGHDAAWIIGGEHIWIYRGVCPKKTSQLGPDPHGMETLGGIQYHDGRPDAENRLELEPQDVELHFNKQIGKSSIMEHGTSRIQRHQGGNIQDFWTWTPHNLFPGCTDSKKEGKILLKDNSNGCSPTTGFT